MGWPRGLIDPLSVADVVLTPEAVPVVAVGGGAEPPISDATSARIVGSVA